MNAVIYARYSAGPRQTDQSIEGQIRVCTDFAKQRGLTIIDTYADRHISGRTDARPEFQRLMNDAKKKKFEAVIVYKTDRFARDKYDSVIYKRELRRNGIQIFYAAEPMPDGPEGIILEGLLESMAEYYSAELAQKINRGLHENALKCLSTGGGPLLGYAIGPDRHFVIEPIGAEAVRIIFDMFVKGIPNMEIADYLNARGFRTARGGTFNKNSFHTIIQNRKYIGEYRYGDVVVPGGMPRIVSDEVFALAQDENERRRTRNAPRSPKAEYLLAGKLFCGECKTAMHGVSGTGKSGNVWYYYACANNRGRRRTCDMKPVSRDHLEEAIVNLTARYILHEEVLQEIAKKVHALMVKENDVSSEKAFLEKKLAANKRAYANIIKAVEEGASIQVFLDRLNELEEEKRVLQTDLACLQTKKPVFSEDQIYFMLSKYLRPFENESEHDYHRRIITCFVAEVYLYNDRLLIYYNLSDGRGHLREQDLKIIEDDGEAFDGIQNRSTTKRSSSIWRSFARAGDGCPELLAAAYSVGPIRQLLFLLKKVLDDMPVMCYHNCKRTAPKRG